MTVDGFRRMALSMPGAEEGSHMEHADFRVKGKIFATLPTPSAARLDADLGMVKLTVDEQRRFMKESPGTFVPAAGAWGERGCTYVLLAGADRETLKRAIEAAWRNAAPKKLVAEFGRE